MPGIPKHAQGRGHGGQRGVEPLDALAVRDGVLLPAPVAHDDLARPVAWVPRFDHRAHRAADHDLADLDRLGVALGLADPAAHVRVHRQVVGLHQELPLGEFRHRRLDEPEVGRLGQALRPGGQDDLTVHGSHRDSFSVIRVFDPRNRARYQSTLALKVKVHGSFPLGDPCPLALYTGIVTGVSSGGGKTHYWGHAWRGLPESRWKFPEEPGNKSAAFSVLSIRPLARLSRFFVNYFSLSSVYTIEYLVGSPRRAACFERKSHDFDTAKLRSAKRDGYIRRSIGEYPVLSIALVTPGRRFPKNTESPVSQRHRAFFVGSVAEMV